jgi:alkyl sulfatase BDS1-like metallo-beta-lactamase superfamily hydrolase
MRTRSIIVFVFVVIAFISGFVGGVYISQIISFKTVRPVIRESGSPEESTLTYTPPAPPKLQWETIKQVRGLKEMTTPTIDKITNDIYLARGFALGSVQMIITEQGLVIIDSTESIDAAEKILKEFRKITDKPIRYLIYTHGHLDHVQGASVFVKDSPNLKVIATKDCVEFMKKDFVEMKEFHSRSRLNQAGLSALEFSRKLPRESPVHTVCTNDDLIWPTVTFDKKYTFTLGGKRFELYHTAGETPDHLMVWLPKERALFCGDLYYMSFPNLSTPMLEPRPVRQWYESLDHMISLKPVYLIPGHTAAITGEDKVCSVLTNYSAAIRYVYEKTIQCINEGKSVDEAVQTVKLPNNLSKLPYLQEFYGRVDWSVRGIYQGIVGWYDGKGTGLTPLSPAMSAREIVALSGGADKILARAIELQKSGEHHLVCELCDIVIAANPNDKLAHSIKASSLEYLGYTCGNLNMFGFYRSATALEKKASWIKP